MSEKDPNCGNWYAAPLRAQPITKDGYVTHDSYGAGSIAFFLKD